MATPPPPATPLEDTSAPRTNSARLNRDDRIRVLTLRDTGHTYKQISNHLGVSYRQVQYTCQSQQSTPKKAPSNPPKLSKEEVDNIINFISSSKRTRRLPFYKVIQELDLDITPLSLARSLKKRGYRRCKALRKPPLLDTNRRLRFAWALEHLNWTAN